LHLFLDVDELGFGCVQVRRGLVQGVSLRFDLTVNVVVDQNVDDPSTQTRSGDGLGADKLWVKVFLIGVGSHRFQGLLADVVLVVVDKVVQKPVHLQTDTKFTNNPMLSIFSANHKYILFSYEFVLLVMHVLTLDMIVALAFFHDLSLGTLPPGASRHMTAAATLTTAAGGEAKAFISVRLPCTINTTRQYCF
jgi:hypothetical protein